MRFTGCALPSLPSSCGSSAATFPTTTVCACTQGSATLHPLPMKRERRDRTTCLRNRGKIPVRPVTSLAKGASAAPDPERNAAIRGLAFEALVLLIVVPLFLFVVLGYGIGLHPAAWLTGRPWFSAWWHPRHGRKPRRRRGRV